MELRDWLADEAARAAGHRLSDGLLADGVRPSSVERIVAPDRVRELLQALAADHLGGAVLGGVGTRLRCHHVAAEEPLPLRLELLGPAPSGPFCAVLEGGHSAYLLAIPCGEPRGALFATPLPTAVVRLRHRRHRRVGAPPGVTATFRSPLRPAEVVECPVRDLSLDGLSLDAADGLVSPGSELTGLALRWSDGAETRLAGRVVHVTVRPAGDGAAAGVHLRAEDSADRDGYRARVEGILHPTVRLGFETADEAFELYGASGYFSLSGAKPADFDEVRAPFARANEAMLVRPDVGFHVTWPSRRGVEVALSMVRLHEGTWFPCALAKRPRGSEPVASARRLLRDVHVATYEKLLGRPEARWLLWYRHDGVSWTAPAYRDFPAQHVASGAALTMDTEVLSGVPGELLARATSGRPTRGGDVTVAVADPGTRDAALAGIAAFRPLVYREALDLVPARCALVPLAAAWQTAGLEREREVFVAYGAAGLLAVAVVDSASPGTHLFGLFDTVRLYPLAEGGERAFDALLVGAARWFEVRRRASFVYLCEDGRAAPAVRLGMRSFGVAQLMVLAVELVPDFLECVVRLTAPADGAKRCG